MKQPLKRVVVAMIAPGMNPNSLFSQVLAMDEVRARLKSERIRSIHSSDTGRNKPCEDDMGKGV